MPRDVFKNLRLPIAGNEKGNMSAGPCHGLSRSATRFSPSFYRLPFAIRVGGVSPVSVVTYNGNKVFPLVQHLVGDTGGNYQNTKIRSAESAWVKLIPSADAPTRNPQSARSIESDGKCTVVCFRKSSTQGWPRLGLMGHRGSYPMGNDDKYRRLFDLDDNRVR